jgi:hypothetical protein|tara:strand:- start:320 stop:424 length:105 start_codon:yes stop_codon:yes gene_type:complete
MTHGSWEYGDTYNNDILQYGELVMSEDEWTKNYD